MAPMLGSVLFNGQIIEVNSLYSCMMTVNNHAFDKWQDIPDNLNVCIMHVI